MALRQETSRRFVGLGSNPQAQFRLFCFPFAGGAASAFREWRFAQGDDLEVVAVELPGRQKRLDEPPLRQVSLLVKDIMAELPLDRPYAMFGHSMGALLIFELARALANSAARPSHLFVSSFRAPHLPQRTRMKHLLPEDELVEEIKRMEGTPQELLEHPEALEMIINLLRADFAVVEGYSYTDAPPLTCPMTAFGGTEDDDVSEQELEQWGVHTTGRFRLQMMAGNHFYLYGAREQLLDSIRADLGLKGRHQLVVSQ
jgi:medium-chain acyl-[acyl-carrier-protein] hydrolase